MTNESPMSPDDESRRIQAEIDRIRSGLKWLKAGRVERSCSPAAGGEDAADDGVNGLEDLRALTERMQAIIARARLHTEQFERMMGRAPEMRVATFVEVQEMLAATLARRKRRPALPRPPSRASKGGGKRKPT
jgi:hypothetical protein